MSVRINIYTERTLIEKDTTPLCEVPQVQALSQFAYFFMEIEEREIERKLRVNLSINHFR